VQIFTAKNQTERRVLYRVLYIVSSFGEKECMRPLGIILIGLYQVLRASVGLVFGLFVLFFNGPATKLVSVAGQGNFIERHLRSFGHAAGLFIIGFAVVHALAGYGVLQMQGWGRLLTLLFCAIEISLLLPTMIRVNIFSLVFGAVNAGCILYLALRPLSIQDDPVRTNS
jgi:hypothetical protein